jgi:hypothetical protein
MRGRSAAVQEATGKPSDEHGRDRHDDARRVDRDRDRDRLLLLAGRLFQEIMVKGTVTDYYYNYYWGRSELERVEIRRSGTKVAEVARQSQSRDRERHSHSRSPTDQSNRGSSE